MEKSLLFLLILLVLVFAWKHIDPKIDWNYETGERLLWYNDPFDIYRRKRIVLYVDKSKIK